MRAVITGATGLLGANLAAELLEQGHSVRATRRSGSRVEHLAALDVDWVEATLEDRNALRRAFDGADVVFHCAAATSIDKRVTERLHRANVLGTDNVLAAFAEADVRRLVHCSSTVAVGISIDGQPVDEDAPWNLAEFGLADGYATTKRISEEHALAAAADLDVVVVNPGFMLGAYDARPSSGALVIGVVLRHAPGASTGFNSFVHVRDVAAGMVAAATGGRRGERYILAGHNLAYPSLFERVSEVAGSKPLRWVVPRSLAAVAGWGGDLQQWLTGREALINSNTVAWGYCDAFVFSSAKAARELSYTIRPIDEGIVDAVEWFRRNGMLGKS